MKNLYLNWRANLINNQTRVSRQVGEWCCRCWENPSVISSKIIKETFLEAGITISLSGEEDYKVKIFDSEKKFMAELSGVLKVETDEEEEEKVKAYLLSLIV